MSEIRDRLTKLRQQEQETRGYGTSSAWYTALRPAISYLELAETSTNPAEKFLNSWRAVYNLTMMIHRRGEIENVTFTHLITEVEAAPKVRSIALATPTAFLEALKKAQTTLLFDAESKKPRESKQLVEIWLDRRKKRGDISPEKACTYLFLIGRDLRNALSHPKLDPNSPVIKKALLQAADIFVPLAIATTEAIIERPPEGTTGRVIAYRSFLYPFLKNSDSPFSDYYLERLFPEQELSAFPEKEAREVVKAINRELETLRGQLVRADADETLQRWCIPVLFQKLGLIVDRNVKVVAEDGIFEPTAVIKKPDLQGRPRHEYKAKDAGRDLACLIWVLPWSVSLDAVSRDEQFESLTMLEVAQRALSRADVDWAILTNGQQVRLLSKTTSHRARSFMEIDLVAIVERRAEREAQLAFRYLLGLCSQASLVERDEQGLTRLDRALRESERHGKEISDELKKNVFSALEELGAGFLAYMQSQPDELDAWRAQRAPSLSAKQFLASQELLTDIYQESLSLMYRLLFLFYAEGRDLLPMDEELYRDTYSLESIREDIRTTHDDPSPTSFFSPGEFNLWSRLAQLSVLVNEGFRIPDGKGGWQEIVPAYNGGLFDPEQHDFLERFKINDRQLASAIDLLSRTQPGTVRGEGRKKVTYRDLDIRHLGSIYEGILEYHADIADQEKVIVKRGTGGKAVREYADLSELTADEKTHLKAYREALAEDEEDPSPPKGCKIEGLIEPGQYYLIYGGRESKRKSSGSYYTPDFIVQYIVENTLGSLLRGEGRLKVDVDESTDESHEFRPLTSEEIFELKVLDPAMGSGHFLVAATEYLARAYGAACIREGKDKDGVMSDDEFVHYKRIIAERCIYGVDINLMAVELAKLSLWLFTMDKGRPLSFLNHHLKWGNGLIGAWIKDLGAPPEIDDKGKVRKKKRRDTKTGNLFEVRFRERVPTMVGDVLAIMGKETLNISDVRAKKALDAAVDGIRRPFRNVADAWVGLYFGEKADDYNSLLVDAEQARNRSSAQAVHQNAFHWELEFPEIFFDRHGRRLTNGGFDSVMGIPPYLYSAAQKFGHYFELFSLAQYQTDYYVYFFERGLSLLKKHGRLGMISSDSWLGNKYFSKLRDALLEKRLIDEVCLFTEPPFEDAVIENAVLISDLPATERNMFNLRVLDPRGNTASLSKLPYTDIYSRDGRTIPARYSSDAESLLRHIETNCDIHLLEKFKINRGIHAYRTDGYGRSKFRDGYQTLRDKEQRSYHANSKLDTTYRPFIKGRDVNLLSHSVAKEFVSYGDWLAESRSPEYFAGPRLVARKIISRRIIATLFLDGSILDQALYVAIPSEKMGSDDMKYYLGQLVSSTAAFYLRNKHQLFDALYPWYTREQLSQLPIVSYEKAGQKADQVVHLVDELLKAKKKEQLESGLLELDEVFSDILSLTARQVGIIDRLEAQ